MFGAVACKRYRPELFIGFVEVVYEYNQLDDNHNFTYSAEKLEVHDADLYGAIQDAVQCIG